MLIATSCKKGAGIGGTSSIIGKVWVKNYNTLNYPTETYNLKGEYWGADENVYIIYGNDISYGEKTKSGPKGEFEFKYLRPGDYKIYLESKDTDRTSISGKMTILKSINVPGKKKTVDAETFTILN